MYFFQSNYFDCLARSSRLSPFAFFREGVWHIIAPLLLLLKHKAAELGTARARIFGEFGRGSLDRLFGDGVTKRDFVTDADRQARRASAGVLPSVHGFFDAAVFAAVESDDTKAAAGFHPAGNIAQKGVDGAEFVIDGDAYGLKDARGGVGMTRFGIAHDATAERCKLGGCLKFTGTRTLGDFARKCAGLADIRVIVQNICEFGIAHAREKFGGSFARLAHAHIERRFGLERKAARDLINLMRRETKVSECEIEAAAGGAVGNVACAQSLIQIHERSLDKDRLQPKRRESRLRRRLRIRIAIKTNDRAIGRNTARNFRGMPRATERDIKIGLAGLWRELREHIVEQNRYVMKFRHKAMTMIGAAYRR